MKRIIHWFRRDLRVSDNTALSEAAKRAEMVVPIFILEEGQTPKCLAMFAAVKKKPLT